MASTFLLRAQEKGTKEKGTKEKGTLMSNPSGS